MKKRKDWNTFFAIEKNLAYDSSMQTTKELSGLGLSAAFAKHSASLSFGALIRKQLAFTFWKIWFFQGLVLAALCAAFFCLYHETLLNQIASPLPEFLCLSSGIVVLSAIPILRRSSRYRMMELEQSTRFSTLGSLSAQLIFIGIGDLAMLSVLAFIVWQDGLTGSVIFIYLIIPFLTAATSCLMLWIRSAPSAFEQRAVLLCAAATLLIWQVINGTKITARTADSGSGICTHFSVSASCTVNIGNCSLSAIRRKCSDPCPHTARARPRPADRQPRRFPQRTCTCICKEEYKQHPVRRHLWNSH